jgi:hypothetical protein
METIQFTQEKLQILAEANKKLNLEKMDGFERSKNIIFVYVPPKVGSTSLVSSLRLFCANKFTICHIHDEVMLKVIANIDNITVLDVIKYNKYIGRNVFVVDIYRWPIERKISEYFETLTEFHFNCVSNEMSANLLQKITKRFNNIFVHLAQKDYLMDKYELSDKLPDKFDQVNKYLLVENQGINYIKLRLHDSTEWSKILTTLLSTEIIIIKDYETEKKEIGGVYKQFLLDYKIPKNLLDIIRNDVRLGFYNTPEEIATYLQKWEQKQAPEYILFYDVVQYALYNEISIENKKAGAIDMKHYIDNGCICRLCSGKRQKLIQKIRNGQEINEKIIHADVCNEYNNNVEKVVKIINKKISNAIKKQNIVIAIAKAKHANKTRVPLVGTKAIQGNFMNKILGVKNG